jgi:hypothetical protein
MATLQGLVRALDHEVSDEDIRQRLRTTTSTADLEGGNTESLRDAYKRQVEADAIDVLLAGKAGCVVVLLAVDTFTNHGSESNSQWEVVENSLLDYQLQVYHALFPV